VLFDVDGTLADTNYLHTLSWARAFADAGVWAPMNAIHRLVGQGGSRLVANLIGEPNPEAEQRRPVHYREMAGDIRIFPGAADLLRACHAAGLAVVFATSAPSEELGLITGRLGCDDVVDAVTTADDVEESKPAPEVFLKAMAAGGIDPARALAVGDSVWDVQAATAAGIGCLAVESGGSSRHELMEAGALQVYRDARQLCDWMATSPLAALPRR
jgi:HAD superfamily hydrolase (TIGR01509 family)